LDFDGMRAPASLPRIAPSAPLPPAAPASEPGQVVREAQSGERYLAEVRMARPGMVLFKMTWYPRWLALVDGKPRSTAILSPGFIGVPVPSGPHNLLMSYEPGFGKLWLALAGLLFAAAAAWAEQRGWLTFLSGAPGGAR